jgi:hypothetical protein
MYFRSGRGAAYGRVALKGEEARRVDGLGRVPDFEPLCDEPSLRAAGLAPTGGQGNRVTPPET